MKVLWLQASVILSFKFILISAKANVGSPQPPMRRVAQRLCLLYEGLTRKPLPMYFLQEVGTTHSLQTSGRNLQNVAIIGVDMLSMYICTNAAGKHYQCKLQNVSTVQPKVQVGVGCRNNTQHAHGHNCPPSHSHEQVACCYYIPLQLASLLVLTVCNLCGVSPCSTSIFKHILQLALCSSGACCLLCTHTTT